MMMFVDDIAALWQWRLYKDPRSALSQRVMDNRDNAVENSAALKNAVEWLPKTFVPWHFSASDASQRFLRNRYGYSVDTNIPPGSFCKVNDIYALASPEYLFVQFARKLPFQLLIKLGYELSGTYAPVKLSDGLPLQRAVPLTDVSKLRHFVERASSAHGSRAAARALKYIQEKSASARESDFAMTTDLPLRWGGYAMHDFMMNYRVEFDEAAKRMSGRTHAKCDLCWPNVKLDVEYDSDLCHGTNRDALSDKSRANALRHMGYTTIFVTNDQFTDMRTCDELMHDIANLTGHRIRQKRGDIPRTRYELHTLLLQSNSHPVFASRSIDELRYFS